NTLAAAERDGKLYAIPRDFTPMVMYYNKDIFDKANVPYPRNGWSFDEFKHTAKKLSTNGKSGFVLTTWMPGWVMWLWNNNGTVLSPDGTKADGHLDSEQNEQTLTFLKSLVDEGIAPRLSEVAATGVDPFANGDAAMAVSGHWALLGYKSAKKVNLDRLGIVSMPTNIGKSHTVYYASGLGIGADCKHPDLAWKFIKHQSAYKFQLQYQASGVAVCARKDVAQVRAQNTIERDFLALVPTARPPSGASVEGYAFVEQQGQKMLESVLNGSQSPREALQKMAARVDKEFAK
ncbi:MAG TPA: sugar ABC transporter substrate-binding protein, partial [Fimbriimonas sp.]|nr:sugar ABC transporter substrate-binding protein [Fimbriimonas sp.]